jgi:hypothetical protein
MVGRDDRTTLVEGITEFLVIFLLGPAIWGLLILVVGMLLYPLLN